MNDIQHALRVLGLGVNATEPEIKQTYRDLAKVWHPDRFANDPRLRSKAQDKLKEINGAYHILRDYRPQRTTGVGAEGDFGGVPRASTEAGFEAARGRRPPSVRSRPTPSSTPSARKTGMRASRWLGVLGAVLAIGVIGYALNQPGHQRHPPHSPPRNPGAIEVPKENSRSWVPSEPAPSMPERKTTGLPNLSDSGGINTPTRSTAASECNIVSSAGLNRGSFTVDSTKEEVLAVQGTPTHSDGRVFTYGNSKVYFNDGRVTRWHNSPTDPLKARLSPSKPNMPNKGYFTVGAKKEEVLAVQGLPTGFDDRVFEYGLSKVYFSAGRVTHWDVQAGFPLRVRSVTTGQSPSGQ